MKSIEQTATAPMRANVGLCTSVLFILMNVDLTLGLVRSPFVYHASRRKYVLFLRFSYGFSENSVMALLGGIFGTKTQILFSRPDPSLIGPLGETRRFRSQRARVVAVFRDDDNATSDSIQYTRTALAARQEHKQTSGCVPFLLIMCPGHARRRGSYRRNES